MTDIRRHPPSASIAVRVNAVVLCILGAVWLSACSGNGNLDASSSRDKQGSTDATQTTSIPSRNFGFKCADAELPRNLTWQEYQADQVEFARGLARLQGATVSDPIPPSPGNGLQEIIENTPPDGQRNYALHSCKSIADFIGNPASLQFRTATLFSGYAGCTTMWTNIANRVSAGSATAPDDAVSQQLQRDLVNVRDTFKRLEKKFQNDPDILAIPIYLCPQFAAEFERERS